MTHLNLKAARRGSGLSVVDLAKRLDMQGSAYRRYERGEVSPKIDQCIQIARILGTTLNDIWGDVIEAPERVDVSYRAKPGQTVVTVVKEDAWREALFFVGVTDRDKPESERSIRRQIRQNLVTKGVAGYWEGLIWAIRDNREIP